MDSSTSRKRRNRRVLAKLVPGLLLGHATPSPKIWEVSPEGSNEPIDMINHPPHYENLPGGVEPITITEHMSFCLGNVIKYCMRAGFKSKDPIEDLKKAAFYINREISRLEKQSSTPYGKNPKEKES